MFQNYELVKWARGIRTVAKALYCGICTFCFEAVVSFKIVRTFKAHCRHKTPICAYFLNHILCDSILTCVLSVFVRATCIYIQCQTVCGEKTHQCGNMVQSGFVRNSLCRMKSCFEMSGRKNLWYRHSLKTPWVMKTDWLLCCFGPLAFIALLL